MKVYLDDIREAPDGWFRVYWPQQVINLIMTGQVEIISLDHDLGDDTKGTGYDVLEWLEEAVHEHGIVPPKIIIHTANPVARARMWAAVKSIMGVGRWAGD
jgi:hypothetical protein